MSAQLNKEVLSLPVKTIITAGTIFGEKKEKEEELTPEENELLNFYNQNKGDFRYFISIGEGGFSLSNTNVYRHRYLPIYYCSGKVFLIDEEHLWFDKKNIIEKIRTLVRM